MKINKRLIFSVLMVLLAIALVTCAAEGGDSYTSPEALLLSLKIGDEPATVPQAITAIQWDSETYSLAGADRGRVSFNDQAAASGQRVRATVVPGARAEWGIGKLGVRPDYFYDPRAPIPQIEDGDHIYIKVSSNDGINVNYYRVFARYKFNVASLNKISIKTREGKMDENSFEGGDVPENATESSISITVGESQGALVEALPYDESATVRYAVVSEDDPAPKDDPDTGETDFLSSTTPLNINDHDWLYVKVIAENTIAKSYFKFKVYVGRMATINTLKFTGGRKGEKEVFGKGLPTESWSTVTAGTFSTAKGDQLAGGFGISIEADDPAAEVVFVKYLISDSGAPVFSAANPTKVEFETGDSLAIKVTSAIGGIINYYRIRVTLLAGNITKQPESGWYMKGATAKPLTIELDPPDTGQYTYEWYEADSWYGIYGRHGYSVDEKANVSCVNGGPGQYFYIVEPDVIPSGGPSNVPQADEPFAWTVGSDKTYTPPTYWEDAGSPGVTANTKPPYPGTTETDIVKARAAGYDPHNAKCYFLQGGSTETRYYWVKITDKDTGLTVTSDRAVILTETDPNMDHFILDLTKLPYRKNLVPFTKQGTDIADGFKIDLTNYPFPDNFNPSKYQICIAHAQYFLPDGRPWTQNWTHGNLLFGYTEGSASFKANGGPLTWYHNNMGANSGSIPLQAPHSAKGGLEYKPDWIGFTAAGDPAKGIPAPDPITGDLPKGIYSMDPKEPYPAGVAQGYFAGFIELLEIHFSTPPSN